MIEEILAHDVGCVVPEAYRVDASPMHAITWVL